MLVGLVLAELLPPLALNLTSIPVPGGSKRHVVDPVPKVGEEGKKVEVESIQEDTDYSGQEEQGNADDLNRELLLDRWCCFLRY